MSTTPSTTPVRSTRLVGREPVPSLAAPRTGSGTREVQSRRSCPAFSEGYLVRGSRSDRTPFPLDHGPSKWTPRGDRTTTIFSVCWLINRLLSRGQRPGSGPGSPGGHPSSRSHVPVRHTCNRIDLCTRVGPVDRTVRAVEPARRHERHFRHKLEKNEKLVIFLIFDRL